MDRNPSSACWILVIFICCLTCYDVIVEFTRVALYLAVHVANAVSGIYLTTAERNHGAAIYTLHPPASGYHPRLAEIEPYHDQNGGNDPFEVVATSGAFIAGIMLAGLGFVVYGRGIFTALNPFQRFSGNMMQEPSRLIGASEDSLGDMSIESFLEAHHEESSSSGDDSSFDEEVHPRRNRPPAETRRGPGDRCIRHRAILAGGTPRVGSLPARNITPSSGNGLMRQLIGRANLAPPTGSPPVSNGAPYENGGGAISLRSTSSPATVVGYRPDRPIRSSRFSVRRNSLSRRQEGDQTRSLIKDQLLKELLNIKEETDRRQKNDQDAENGVESRYINVLDEVIANSPPMDFTVTISDSTTNNAMTKRPDILENMSEPSLYSVFVADDSTVAVSSGAITSEFVARHASGGLPADFPDNHDRCTSKSKNVEEDKHLVQKVPTLNKKSSQQLDAVSEELYSESRSFRNQLDVTSSDPDSSLLTPDPMALRDEFLGCNSTTLLRGCDRNDGGNIADVSGNGSDESFGGVYSRGDELPSPCSTCDVSSDERRSSDDCSTCSSSRSNSMEDQRFQGGRPGDSDYSSSTPVTKSPRRFKKRRYDFDADTALALSAKSSRGGDSARKSRSGPDQQIDVVINSGTMSERQGKDPVVWKNSVSSRSSFEKRKRSKDHSTTRSSSLTKPTGAHPPPDQQKTSHTKKTKKHSRRGRSMRMLNRSALMTPKEEEELLAAVLKLLRNDEYVKSSGSNSSVEIKLAQLSTPDQIADAFTSTDDLHSHGIWDPKHFKRPKKIKVSPRASGHRATKLYRLLVKESISLKKIQNKLAKQRAKELKKRQTKEDRKRSTSSGGSLIRENSNQPDSTRKSRTKRTSSGHTSPKAERLKINIVQTGPTRNSELPPTKKLSSSPFLASPPGGRSRNKRDQKRRLSYSPYDNKDFWGKRHRLPSDFALPRRIKALEFEVPKDKLPPGWPPWQPLSSRLKTIKIEPKVLPAKLFTPAAQRSVVMMKSQGSQTDTSKGRKGSKKASRNASSKGSTQSSQLNVSSKAHQASTVSEGRKIIMRIYKTHPPPNFNIPGRSFSRQLSDIGRSSTGSRRMSRRRARRVFRSTSKPPSYHRTRSRRSSSRRHSRKSSTSRRHRASSLPGIPNKYSLTWAREYRPGSLRPSYVQHTPRQHTSRTAEMIWQQSDIFNKLKMMKKLQRRRLSNGRRPSSSRRHSHGELKAAKSEPQDISVVKRLSLADAEQPLPAAASFPDLFSGFKADTPESSDFMNLKPVEENRPKTGESRVTHIRLDGSKSVWLTKFEHDSPSHEQTPKPKVVNQSHRPLLETLAGAIVGANEKTCARTKRGKRGRCGVGFSMKNKRPVTYHEFKEKLVAPPLNDASTFSPRSSTVNREEVKVIQAPCSDTSLSQRTYRSIKIPRRCLSEEAYPELDITNFQTNLQPSNVSSDSLITTFSPSEERIVPRIFQQRSVGDEPVSEERLAPGEVLSTASPAVEGRLYSVQDSLAEIRQHSGDEKVAPFWNNLTDGIQNLIKTTISRGRQSLINTDRTMTSNQLSNRIQGKQVEAAQREIDRRDLRADSEVNMMPTAPAGNLASLANVVMGPLESLMEKIQDARRVMPDAVEAVAQRSKVKSLRSSSEASKATSSASRARKRSTGLFKTGKNFKAKGSDETPDGGNGLQLVSTATNTSRSQRSAPEDSKDPVERSEGSKSRRTPNSATNANNLRSRRNHQSEPPSSKPSTKSRSSTHTRQSKSSEQTSPKPLLTGKEYEIIFTKMFPAMLKEEPKAGQEQLSQPAKPGVCGGKRRRSRKLPSTPAAVTNSTKPLTSRRPLKKQTTIVQETLTMEMSIDGEADEGRRRSSSLVKVGKLNRSMKQQAVVSPPNGGAPHPKGKKKPTIKKHPTAPDLGYNAPSKHLPAGSPGALSPSTTMRSITQISKDTDESRSEPSSVSATESSTQSSRRSSSHPSRTGPSSRSTITMASYTTDSTSLSRLISTESSGIYSVVTNKFALTNTLKTTALQSAHLYSKLASVSPSQAAADAAGTITAITAVSATYTTASTSKGVAGGGAPRKHSLKGKRFVRPRMSQSVGGKRRKNSTASVRTPAQGTLTSQRTELDVERAFDVSSQSKHSSGSKKDQSTDFPTPVIFHAPVRLPGPPQVKTDAKSGTAVSGRQTPVVVAGVKRPVSAGAMLGSSRLKRR